MNDFQKLKEKINNLVEDINEKNTILNDRIDVLEKNLEYLKTEFQTNKKQADNLIKNQEEIIMDMINKFNEHFLEYKTKTISEIGELKTQQDILKISYSVNEKRLFEKMQDEIKNQMKESVRGKEKEILMNIWIDELKEIINKFDNLKKLHPRKFNTQIQEISKVIAHFKKQISE